MGRYLGQHFLVDPVAIEKALQQFLPIETAIVEVGPGTMALTQHLFPLQNPLLLIERDDKLIPNLQKVIRTRPNTHLLHADVLTVDFAALSQQLGGPFALISNLPYLITTPFLEKLLVYSSHLTKVHLMLQKEVVEKMCATYGPRACKLGHLLALFYEKIPGSTIPPRAFSPPPKVDSQYLTLIPKTPLLPPEELPRFTKLLHTAFNHRQHTLHWFCKQQAYPLPLGSSQKIEDLTLADLIEFYASIRT